MKMYALVFLMSICFGTNADKPFEQQAETRSALFGRLGQGFIPGIGVTGFGNNPLADPELVELIQLMTFLNEKENNLGVSNAGSNNFRSASLTDAVSQNQQSLFSALNNQNIQQGSSPLQVQTLLNAQRQNQFLPQNQNNLQQLQLASLLSNPGVNSGLNQGFNPLSGLNSPSNPLNALLNPGISGIHRLGLSNQNGFNPLNQLALLRGLNPGLGLGNPFSQLNPSGFLRSPQLSLNIHDNPYPINPNHKLGDGSQFNIQRRSDERSHDRRDRRFVFPRNK